MLTSKNTHRSMTTRNGYYLLGGDLQENQFARSFESKEEQTFDIP